MKNKRTRSSSVGDEERKPLRVLRPNVQISNRQGSPTDREGKSGAAVTERNDATPNESTRVPNTNQRWRVRGKVHFTQLQEELGARLVARQRVRGSKLEVGKAMWKRIMRECSREWTMLSLHSESVWAAHMNRCASCADNVKGFVDDMIDESLITAVEAAQGMTVEVLYIRYATTNPTTAG